MVPVASMGDIAFLLIIFFMLCSRFAKEKATVEAPQAPRIEEIKETLISVTVDRDGVIYFQGRRASVKDVEWGVRAMVEGKTQQRDKTVVFRCDRNLSRMKFEPVIEAIAKGGGLIAAVGDEKAE
jgi:biopolymer transport protein ExbD